MRLRVRFWAVLVPLHITSTSPVPLRYSYTQMKLKPARLHEPPLTTTPSTVCGGRREVTLAQGKDGCYSVRLKVRFWALLVPLHITNTNPIRFPYSYTHMKLKPARLHQPPLTTTPSTVCGGDHEVTLAEG